MQISLPFFNLPSGEKEGRRRAGRMGPRRLAGDGRGERGGAGNLTPYLDSAEERRRRPTTKRRGGGGPAARCAVAEGNRRPRATACGGGVAEEHRRGDVEV